MRAMLLLLVLAATVFGEPQIETALRRLNEVRVDALAPGARARVFPAIEKVSETGDVRGVAPLAVFMVEVILSEAKVEEAVRATTRRGAVAYERMQALDKEMVHLKMRQQAGAPDVGPKIEERKAEHARQRRIFEEVQQDVDRFDRSITLATDMREKLVAALVVLVKVLPADKVQVGLVGLRQALDVTDRLQSLYLVRILRASGRREATSHLIDVLTHTKVPTATRRAAASALAAAGDREAVKALIALWERDPDGLGAHVRHVLSLAARRDLATLATAREWAATLK